MIIFDFSVSFKNNIDSTNAIKGDRYRHLVPDIVKNSFILDYYLTEIRLWGSSLPKEINTVS